MANSSVWTVCILIAIVGNRVYLSLAGMQTILAVLLVSCWVISLHKSRKTSGTHIRSEKYKFIRPISW